MGIWEILGSIGRNARKGSRTQWPSAGSAIMGPLYTWCVLCVPGGRSVYLLVDVTYNVLHLCRLQMVRTDPQIQPIVCTHQTYPLDRTLVTYSVLHLCRLRTHAPRMSPRITSVYMGSTHSHYLLSVCYSTARLASEQRPWCAYLLL